MNPLYSVADIRAIERAAAASMAAGTLMQRAGQAAAHAALAMAPAGPVLVLAGPGNNGGDALEAAANLALLGIDVTIIHCAGNGAVAPETAHALRRAQGSAALFADSIEVEQPWALVIDGLFGIGLARPLEGRVRGLADSVNQAPWPVLALDVPSGLDADTGAVIGRDGVAIEATRTITFIGDKPGLHTFEGRDHAGEVQVASLDIDAALFPAAAMHLSSPALFGHARRARRHNSHKGSFGDVAILGGAEGMTGAAVLAARAALYSGAGRVIVAALGPAPAYDVLQPEIMFRSAAQFKPKNCTWAAGPGMGDGALAINALSRAMDSDAPMVIDADALNLIAASADLQSRASARPAPTILTPHPLEAARLLGVTAPVVQADRLAAAREIAARMQAIVILKGSGSVIADTSGKLAINPTGNPGLATGGTGDVLAGLCASLLAQGWPAWEAAVGAAWLHGRAADVLVEHGCGPAGLTAGELAPAIRQLLN